MSLPADSATATPDCPRRPVRHGRHPGGFHGHRGAGVGRVRRTLRPGYRRDSPDLPRRPGMRHGAALRPGRRRCPGPRRRARRDGTVRTAGIVAVPGALQLLRSLPGGRGGAGDIRRPAWPTSAWTPPACPCRPRRSRRTLSPGASRTRKDTCGPPPAGRGPGGRRGVRGRTCRHRRRSGRRHPDRGRGPEHRRHCPTACCISRTTPRSPPRWRPARTAVSLFLSSSDALRGCCAGCGTGVRQKGPVPGRGPISSPLSGLLGVAGTPQGPGSRGSGALRQRQSGAEMLRLQSLGNWGISTSCWRGGSSGRRKESRSAP